MADRTHSLVTETATSIEGGVEKGVWIGVAGAVLGFMLLPVLGGLGGAAAFALSSAGEGAGLLSVLGVGAAVTAATAILAFPINRRLADLGTLVGGILGFAKGAEEAEERTYARDLERAAQLETRRGGLTQSAPVQPLASRHAETSTPAAQPETTPRPRHLIHSQETLYQTSLAPAPYGQEKS